MADEQQEQAQAQADASKKVNVPDNVTTNNGEDIGAILAKHQGHTERNKELLTRYGVKTAAQFIDVVKSNAMIAQRVAEELLGIEDSVGAAGLILDPQAPQELNITGMVDNTGDVATKLHISGESKSPSVVDNTSGTNSGENQ